MKLANSKLDECRRRVQNDTLGHRGRKHDPLYRARRLLTKAHESLDENGETKLLGLLAAGDPHGEVRNAWHAKEIVRSIYDITDADTHLLDRLLSEIFPIGCMTHETGEVGGPWGRRRVLARVRWTAAMTARCPLRRANPSHTASHIRADDDQG